MIDLNQLRAINVLEKIAITFHAQQRLYERGITLSDVMKVISDGEIIMQYEDDKPLPSCLILGKSVNNQYMHVVISTDGEYIYLITAYYPSLDVWNSDYKTRRR